MSASTLGLDAVLATSALVFTGLRWLGGAYLVYLGIRLWRAPAHMAGLQAAPAARPWHMVVHAYALTAMNPKGIIFFVALLPQFLDASRAFFRRLLSWWAPLSLWQP